MWQDANFNFWFKNFTKAGIDEIYATRYAMQFVEERFFPSHITMLTKSILQDLNIHLGDQTLILDYISGFCDTVSGRTKTMKQGSGFSGPQGAYNTGYPMRYPYNKRGQGRMGFRKSMEDLQAPNQMYDYGDRRSTGPPRNSNRHDYKEPNKNSGWTNDYRRRRSLSCGPEDKKNMEFPPGMRAADHGGPYPPQPGPPWGRDNRNYQAYYQPQGGAKYRPHGGHFQRYGSQGPEDFQHFDRGNSNTLSDQEPERPSTPGTPAPKDPQSSGEQEGNTSVGDTKKEPKREKTPRLFPLTVDGVNRALRNWMGENPKFLTESNQKKPQALESFYFNYMKKAEEKNKEHSKVPCPLPPSNGVGIRKSSDSLLNKKKVKHMLLRFRSEVAVEEIPQVTKNPSIYRRINGRNKQKDFKYADPLIDNEKLISTMSLEKFLAFTSKITPTHLGNGHE